jgi:hypothetical protein
VRRRLKTAVSNISQAVANALVTAEKCFKTRLENRPPVAQKSQDSRKETRWGKWTEYGKFGDKQKMRKNAEHWGRCECARVRVRVRVCV